jgi:hypothetical protein
MFARDGEAWRPTLGCKLAAASDDDYDDDDE